MEVTIEQIPDASLDQTNCAYCNPSDYLAWSKLGTHVRPIGKNPYFAYQLQPHEKMAKGTLGLNQIQRLDIFVSTREKLPIELLASAPTADVLSFQLEFRNRKKRQAPIVINVQEVITQLKERHVGQLFAINQKLLARIDGTALFCTVQTMVSGKTMIEENGTLVEGTEIEILPSVDSELRLVDYPLDASDPQRYKKNVYALHAPSPMKDIPIEQLGVGGLGKQFREMFRRAFASRCLHPETLKKFEMGHVKGILLYGPTGTGKTLLAKTIAKMLNCEDIKRISASEVLSKWVGEAEQRVRELFVEAELEWAQKGDYSSLHVIIIDEIDAICRQRASTQSQTGDSIVNQLLSKMEGMEEIRNFLVIGMTNRKDLIDTALLRPGRFEVQVEIGLPDEAGRKDILTIHTKGIRQSGKMAEDVDLKHYAKITKNFSGAELGGLVRSATAFALERSLGHDQRDSQTYTIKDEDIQITRADFDRALGDIKPAFGLNIEVLDELVPECGFIKYNEELEAVLQVGSEWIAQAETSPIMRLFSLLITGEQGSGKTSIAAQLARDSTAPHVKIISSEEFISLHEQDIASKIHQVFRDCYKSPYSLLILDNLERLLSYSEVGVRYSNYVLQTLLSLLVKQPPEGRRLFILGTTGDYRAIQLLGLGKLFQKRLEVPKVNLEGTEKTIQELLVDIESSRLRLSGKEFDRSIARLGKPFEVLKERHNL